MGAISNVDYNDPPEELSWVPYLMYPWLSTRGFGVGAISDVALNNPLEELAMVSYLM